MKKETLDFLTKKTHDLMDAPSCCPEAKKAALDWLDCVGTDREADETKKYIAEIEDCILPIDDLIAFTASENGIKIFGEEKAKEFNAHGREIKEKGAKFCDCPACSAISEILERKSEILG